MSLPIVTVGALIYDPAGRVLLIRTHKWRDLYGLPGGKIHAGETMHAALAREIKEETGLEIWDIRFLLAQDCIDSPEFYKPAHFVLLNFACQSKGGAVTLNDEAEAFVWVTPREALRMALNTPTHTLVRHALEARHAD